MNFWERLHDLPVLGLGVSTEYGAHRSGGLCPKTLRDLHPQWASFLEIGVQIDKGLDEDAQAWVAQMAPCTYHFLDINLDEPEDLDPSWLNQVRQVIAHSKPAWLCGDAGMWHIGPRDRNHMLLLPPILCPHAAQDQALGVKALREACGLEVLPENPPGTAFVGPMHILEFFAKVCQDADTGMLLDVAHLAMFQHVRGHDVLAGMQDFDLSRVIELHIAGTTPGSSPEGFSFIEDTHGPQVSAETWTLYEHVLANAPNLRAVVVEGERNEITQIAPVFERAHKLWSQHPNGAHA